MKIILAAILLCMTVNQAKSLKMVPGMKADKTISKKNQKSEVDIEILSIDSIISSKKDNEESIKSIFMQKLEYISKEIEPIALRGSDLNGTITIKYIASTKKAKAKSEIISSTINSKDFENNISRLVKLPEYKASTNSFTIKLKVNHPNFKRARSLNSSTIKYTKTLETIMLDPNVIASLKSFNAYYPILFDYVWEHDLDKDGEKDLIFSCSNQKNQKTDFLTDGTPDINNYYVVSKIKNKTPYKNYVLKIPSEFYDLEIDKVNKGQINAFKNDYGVNSNSQKRKYLKKSPLTFVIDNNILLLKDQIGSPIHKIIGDDIFIKHSEDLLNYDKDFNLIKSQAFQNSEYKFNSVISGLHTFKFYFHIEPISIGPNVGAPKTLRHILQNGLDALIENTTKTYKAQLSEVKKHIIYLSSAQIEDKLLDNDLKFSISDSSKVDITYSENQERFTIYIETSK